MVKWSELCEAARSLYVEKNTLLADDFFLGFNEPYLYPLLALDLSKRVDPFYSE